MQINKMHSYTTTENLIYNKSSKMHNIFIRLKKNPQYSAVGLGGKHSI